MYANSRTMVFKLFNVFSIVFVVAVFSAFGQQDIYEQSKTAFKSSNPKELVKLFEDEVDITIDGEKGTYNKHQAEFVLKDFFKKYPGMDMKVVHSGASDRGDRYAVCDYYYKGGQMRVIMYMKEQAGKYKITVLNLVKE